MVGTGSGKHGLHGGSTGGGGGGIDGGGNRGRGGNIKLELSDDGLLYGEVRSTKGKEYLELGGVFGAMYTGLMDREGD